METSMMTPRQTLAAAALFAAGAWVSSPAPRRQETAEAMLAAIVEADAAAMEANDLANMGAIPHDRYERLAQARDAAIERAAEFLGR